MMVSSTRYLVTATALAIIAAFGGAACLQPGHCAIGLEGDSAIAHDHEHHTHPEHCCHEPQPQDEPVEHSHHSDSECLLCAPGALAAIHFVETPIGVSQVSASPMPALRETQFARGYYFLPDSRGPPILNG